MSSWDDNFRRQADLVRQLPLEAVLSVGGATRDPHDRSRWHTSRGPISVTGCQFFNWHDHQGRGGAIDLAMHLNRCSAAQAIAWLMTQFAAEVAALRTAPAAPRGPAYASGQPRRPLRLPAPSKCQLSRVRRYLTEQRGLRGDLLDPLIESQRIYADERGNAVFVMVAGKPPRITGAELRGTAGKTFRGLAPGTRRDAGYFWIGDVTSKAIVLCESAIDAISCHQFHVPLGHTERDPGRAAKAPGSYIPYICISTAGVRPDAPWLVPLFQRGYALYCGFDNDAPGEAAATQMLRRHPSMQRLHPPAHDWNDALRLR